jgi:hypothetical protein
MFNVKELLDVERNQVSADLQARQHQLQQVKDIYLNFYIMLSMNQLTSRLGSISYKR